MVARFGMSDLGYLNLAENDSSGYSKPFSNSTQKVTCLIQLIDEHTKLIINQCIDRTREMVREYKEQISIIAEELLAKETIDLLDIINLLGDRPHKLPKSIEAYLREIKERKSKASEDEGAGEGEEPSAEVAVDQPSAKGESSI